MEWVETTGRTLEEAKEAALDQLGVLAEEAEFTILAEPRHGLFGRLRGEARVRARVRPAPVRPKQDRRRGRRSGGSGSGGDRGGGTNDRSGAQGGGPATDATGTAAPDAAAPSDAAEGPANTDATSVTTTVTDAGSEEPAVRTQPAEGRPAGPRSRRRRGGRGRRRRRQGERASAATTDTVEGAPMTTNDAAAASEGAAGTADQPAPSTADVEAVRTAALGFVSGLTSAFGFDAEVTAVVEGSEIEVRVDGPSLGLLIGPGGRTLLAIQDLTRVAAQRRLGDHDTRLRVDVAGYRERRREALVRFATDVAQQVKETGVPRSLDPMPSADRKILHDVFASIEGVTSRSEGEDPYRRVVVTPA